MMIGVYYPANDKVHEKVLHAFYTGLLELDEIVTFTSLDCYNPDMVDLAVVFGVEKRNVPVSKLRGDVIREQKRKGQDTLILERGYINRGNYWAVGLNGLNNRALFNNYMSPPDRFDALGIDLKPWRDVADGYNLLIGQVPWDASVQHTDHIGWLTDTVAVMQHFSDMPIILRPHPLATTATPLILGTGQGPQTLEEALSGAATVVTFNSNTGVDAVIAGVPTFCADPGSMVYPHCSNLLSELQVPPIWDRHQWAADIAYCQWTLAEMGAGLPWQHMRPLILDRLHDREEIA